VGGAAAQGLEGGAKQRRKTARGRRKAQEEGRRMEGRKRGKGRQEGAITDPELRAVATVDSRVLDAVLQASKPASPCDRRRRL
jgi:hypothetical protein